jgi:hypothetical protein
MTISRGQMNRQLYNSGTMGGQEDFEKFLEDMKSRDMGAMQDQILRDFQEYMRRKKMIEQMPEARGNGIMDVVPREEAFLGGVKKVFKKATKGLKDIVKYDIGKAALVGAGLYFGGPTIMKGLKGIGSIVKAAKVPAFLKSQSGLATLGIGAGALFGGAMAGKSEEEVQALTRDTGALKSYLSQYYTNLNPELRNQPEKVEQFVNSQIAEYNQGRGGYAAGGDTASENAMQAAGIEGLPIRQNPKGVKELDLRDNGGFIPPVGIKEKEDDIPAMLSNNEFVFTADAVRGMGDGDVELGAQRMYDQMKMLEKGGRV